MHKKRPPDPIPTIVTLLWMTAGNAKIRDGAVGIYSRPFFQLHQLDRSSSRESAVLPPLHLNGANMAVRFGGKERKSVTFVSCVLSRPGVFAYGDVRPNRVKRVGVPRE